MHQQIRVAPNRAGEVGVSLISQTKVTAVHGRVDGLLHRTQQHGVDLLRIRAVFGRLRDFLKLAGVWVVADAQPQAQCLEVVAQDVFFLGRRAFVDPEQTGVFALLNEIGTADVGRQHGFFDQAVGFVAHTRHDFFNPTVLIADDLGFSGFKVHRTTHRA